MKRLLISLCVVLLAAVACLGHAGHPHDEASLLESWTFDPLVILSLTVTGGLYVLGLSNLWREGGFGRGISGWETIWFAAGWVSLVIALVSPVHVWGEVLFSAHMTQHEILMMISAPLFVMGRPLIAWLWALPMSWRKAAGGVAKWRPFENTWRFVTNAFAAFLIHAAALWIWHIPYLFQATIESDLVHMVQHLSFFCSALLFWWAIIYGRRDAASYGAGILYLFATSMHSGLLGAFLTFTHRVWYPIYAQSTAEWGLTPIEDQQLGGLIMWVPAGIVYIFAALIMFTGWLRESERGTLRREAAMAADQL